VSFQQALFAEPSVPNPHCTIADVWKAAIGAGAPASAVATITYQRPLLTRGPWHFAIVGTKHEYDITHTDCTIAATR
jgi:hypothetical protein